RVRRAAPLRGGDGDAARDRGAGPYPPAAAADAGLDLRDPEAERDPRFRADVGRHDVVTKALSSSPRAHRSPEPGGRTSAWLDLFASRSSAAASLHAIISSHGRTSPQRAWTWSRSATSIRRR